jgi:hypothetical protein
MKGNLSCVSCRVLCLVLLSEVLLSISYLYHKTIRRFRWNDHGVSVVLEQYETRNDPFSDCHAVPVSSVLLSCFATTSCVVAHCNKTLIETEARQTA